MNDDHEELYWSEEVIAPPPRDEVAVANYLLQNYTIYPVDAARLVLELLERCPNLDTTSHDTTVNSCREIIQCGVEAYVATQQSVSFKDAVESLRQYRNSARERTLSEIRQICKRIMREAPEWQELIVRNINTAMCQQTIERIFHTVPMQRKAKRILHAVFAHAKQNGWCAGNPLDLVIFAPYREKPISALPIREVLKLLHTVEKPEHELCAAAVGIMLWAGVRPHELMRLCHGDINFEDRVITIPACHSKTGGARQVTMYPPLYYWLRKHIHYYHPEAPIVPMAWNARWLRLRRDAGFSRWVPDILRHTFASYHLKYYKNLSALQVDMGHTTLELLRTRYLAMQHVTGKAAKIFWEYGVPRRTVSSE